MGDLSIPTQTFISTLAMSMNNLPRSRFSHWIASLIIFATAICNFAVSLNYVRHADVQTEVTIVDESKYSYIGYDYPEDYPMGPLPQVLLTPEDSVHYPLSGPTAAAQWASNSPSGTGDVRLGNIKRDLFISMFHQLHCLRYVRQALVTADDPFAKIPHCQHCLNYIRQMVLCQPDLTLEDPGWRKHGWEAGRRGTTHVCRDWGTVYAEMDKNWVQWEHWRNATRGMDVLEI